MIQPLLFVLMSGLSAAETNKPEPVSVIEGDDVTLETGLTEILNGDTIVWLSGSKDTFLSHIEKKDDIPSFFVTDDVAFRGRLQVNQNTGFLTIRNTRIRHSGQYKVSIARKETTIKIFHVTVSAVANETDVKSDSVSALVGEPVILKPDAGKYKDALMLWRFGDKGVLLAKIDTEMNETYTDEGFKGRMQLNQNGSLIIRNSRTEDSGLYELQIKGSESSVKTFILSVSDPSLSSGAVAGIIIAVLLFLGAAAAAAAIYYHRRIANIKKKWKKNEKRMDVFEGHSVTLPSGLDEIHRNDTAMWLFATEVIAKTEKGKNERFPGTDGRFISKLEMGNNGNLAISNIRNIHSGLYELKINRGDKIKKNIYKRFVVTVKVRTIPVKEGETATLNTTAEINEGDLILWTLGHKNLLVIKKNGPTVAVNERFRDRLTLDDNTGALEIRNITKEDSGHFKLQVINYENTTFRRFNVKVTTSTEENTENESNELLDPLSGEPSAVLQSSRTDE